MAEGKKIRKPLFEIYVSQEEKLRRTIIAKKQRQSFLAMMASGNLPPDLEILEIPSTVAGQPPSFAYKYPCKMTRTSASQRAAIRAARRNNTTTNTAGTTAPVGGSVLNKEPRKSSQTLVENLKLAELRISN